jgi:hypothetical protein
MSNLVAYLKRLVERKFYGKIVIAFEAGKVVRFEVSATEDAKQFN